MIKPNINEFNLRQISQNLFQLADRSPPVPEDYNLTEDQVEQVIHENQNRIVNKDWFFNILFFILLGILFIILPGNLKWLTFFGFFVLLLINFGIVEKLSELTETTEYKAAISYKEKLKAYNECLAEAVLNYENAIKNYNLWKKQQQIDFWYSLSGREIEKELNKIFRKQGYRTFLTKASSDKGIDIWLNKNDKKIIVQCKAHKKPIGPNVARDLYGTLIASKASEAFLISISGFTTGVYNFVKRKRIKLYTLNDIIAWIKIL